MAKVLGIDSSTQATKAVLIDSDSGELIAEARAPHPIGTEVSPSSWLTALDQATADLLPLADAVSVAGQQHGMVALDAKDRVIRDALLWNDTRSASSASHLIEEIGGPQATIERTGSLLVASITSTKLRWMRDYEPDNARTTKRVVLPHDYVTHHLAPGARWFTDRGDASGTGYFSPALDGWDEELAEMALGHPIDLPDIAPQPHAIMSETVSGVPVASGTGDNMAAALALGLGPGDVMLSIGTSGVAASVSSQPVFDLNGSVTGFADASGHWLPLVCTINASRILNFACSLLSVNYDELSRMALSAPPGSHGVVFLPYMDGERTPNRPDASGVLKGITSTTTRHDIARACVEALACSLTDAIDLLLKASRQTCQRIVAVGGGAKSPALRRILPQIIGREIEFPRADEYVARGAAVQAAWALSGTPQPPSWQILNTATHNDIATPEVLEKYRALRDDTISW